MSQSKDFLKNTGGATATEYGLIAAFVAAMAIVFFFAISDGHKHPNTSNPPAASALRKPGT